MFSSKGWVDQKACQGLLGMTKKQQNLFLSSLQVLTQPLMVPSFLGSKRKILGSPVFYVFLLLVFWMHRGIFFHGIFSTPPMLRLKFSSIADAGLLVHGFGDRRSVASVFGRATVAFGKILFGFDFGAVLGAFNIFAFWLLSLNQIFLGPGDSLFLKLKA